MFLTEHNVWIHVTVAIVVIIAGFYFQISKEEWLFIVFAIGLVILSEGFNTAIEYLSNAVSESYNEKIKCAKDIAAGAVFLAAITAAIIGLLIFVPYIVNLFNAY